MTKKQRQLLTFIEGFIATNDYAPTYREIMTSLQYRSVSTVAIHVDNLVRLGYLEKKDHSARSLKLTQVSRNLKQLDWLLRKINQKLALYQQKNTSQKQFHQEIEAIVQTLTFLDYPDAANAIRKKYGLDSIDKL